MYLDPSEGKVGAGLSLDTVYGAITSGALKVDPKTGDATLRFLTEVEDLTSKMGIHMKGAAVATPLGGGFGEQIGKFNQRLAAGGSNCAEEMLTKFSEEIKRLKSAVSMSMNSYQAMDNVNGHTVSKAGGGGW